MKGGDGVQALIAKFSSDPSKDTSPRYTTNPIYTTNSRLANNVKAYRPYFNFTKTQQNLEQKLFRKQSENPSIRSKIPQFNIRRRNGPSNATLERLIHKIPMPNL